MKGSLRQAYIDCAATLGLGDLTKVKTGTKERRNLVTICADGFINATKAGEEEKRSAYISALMLLFWGEINKMADKCKGVPGLDYNDFVMKLYECINIACDYNAWAGGKHTAEACIRTVIASRGAAATLGESNLDKKKANANIYSLDTTISDEDGREVTLGDAIYDDEEEELEMADLNVKWLIQSFINKNKIIEGIILDSIAYNDVQRVTKEKHTRTDYKGNTYDYTTSTAEFWSYKLVQVLSKLPENYFDYFFNKYGVKDIELKTAIDRIKSCNNQKLYKMIEATLAKCRVTIQH